MNYPKASKAIDSLNSPLADELIASAESMGIPIDTDCVSPHDFVAAGQAGVENMACPVAETTLLNALAHQDYRRAAGAILSHPRSISFPRLSGARLAATAAGAGPVPPEIAIAVRTAAKAVLGGPAS
mgnify:CR=1 FL=1